MRILENRYSARWRVTVALQGFSGSMVMSMGGRQRGAREHGSEK